MCRRGKGETIESILHPSLFAVLERMHLELSLHAERKAGVVRDGYLGDKFESSKPTLSFLTGHWDKHSTRNFTNLAI